MHIDMTLPITKGSLLDISPISKINDIFLVRAGEKCVIESLGRKSITSDLSRMWEAKTLKDNLQFARYEIEGISEDGYLVFSRMNTKYYFKPESVSIV